MMRGVPRPSATPAADPRRGQAAPPRESQVQPLLLLFEDLHRIDSESQAWLTALLGQDGTLATFKRVLIERTEGNPFFLDETVQTLVETKVLVGDRGAYRITKAPEAWQIPATVQAILAARIDRLPPEDKPLLQAASVIGKAVPFTLLQAIADVPEDSLRRGLTDRRRALHARIVEAIEALYLDRLAEQVERLAQHAHPDVATAAAHYGAAMTLAFELEMRPLVASATAA